MPANLDKVAMIVLGAIVLTAGFGCAYLFVFRPNEYREWERKNRGFEVGSNGGLRFAGVMMFLIVGFMSRAFIQFVITPSVEVTSEQPNAFTSWTGFVFGLCGIAISVQLLFGDKIAPSRGPIFLERWPMESRSRAVTGILLLLGSTCLVLASAKLFFH